MRQVYSSIALVMIMAGCTAMTSVAAPSTSSASTTVAQAEKPKVPAKGLSAKVKKKNGQMVQGEIQGLIAQKSNVFKRDESGFFVGYNVIEGKNIESIDERGVNLVKGATFLLSIHSFHEREQQSDDFVLGLVGRYAKAGLVGSSVNASFSGGEIVTKTAEGKNLTDTLLGEITDKSQGSRIVPALRIATQQGIVEVPINDVVTFKQKNSRNR